MWKPIDKEDKASTQQIPRTKEKKAKAGLVESQILTRAYRSWIVVLPPSANMPKCSYFTRRGSSGIGHPRPSVQEKTQQEGINGTELCFQATTTTPWYDRPSQQRFAAVPKIRHSIHASIENWPAPSNPWNSGRLALARAMRCLTRNFKSKYILGSENLTGIHVKQRGEIVSQRMSGT